MPPPTIKWDAAAIDWLKALVNQGLSGKEIGLLFGTSRSTILGKLWRLKMRTKFRQYPPRLNSRTNPPKPKRKRQNRPAKLIIAAVPEVIMSQTPKPGSGTTLTGIFDLKADQCRWPVEGTGHLTLFCGALVYERHPYCWDHYCRAHTNPPRLTRAEYELHMRKLAKDRQAIQPDSSAILRPHLGA